jgi:hypothetical protein
LGKGGDNQKKKERSKLSHHQFPGRRHVEVHGAQRDKMQESALLHRNGHGV